MMNYIQKLYGSLQARILRTAPDAAVIVEAASRTGAGHVPLRQEARSLQAKTLRQLKQAVMAASDPYRPDFQELEEIHTNLLMDNHLASVIESRILHTQRSKIRMVNDSGTENPDAGWLLQRPWFEELIHHFVMSRFRGRQLIELYDLDEADELATVTRIPQSHFNVKDGYIMHEPGDASGVDYRRGRMRDFYVQVGKDYELGMLTEMSTAILAKKLGFGSWLDYIDKYGIPPLFITTDREDPKRLNELFEAATNFRKNHFMVGRGAEQFTIPNVGGVDAFNTFDKLIERVNSEVSKRVLGGSGTSDEKAHVGSAEIQFRLTKDRYEADKSSFKYWFNTVVKPRLVKLSPVYAPLANTWLDWDDTHTMDTPEYIDSVTKLATHFLIDPEKVSERTGIEIIGHKSYGTHTDGEGGDPPKKPEAVLAYYRDGKRLREIDAHYAGIECGCGPENGPEAIDLSGWNDILDRIARDLHSGAITAKDLNREAILKTYRNLDTAASEGYGKDWITYGSEAGRGRVQEMKQNLFRFATGKTEAWQLEMSRLITRDGKVVPFDEFRQEVAKVHEKYNVNHLRAEYNTARKQADMAAKWEEYTQNADLFPNLKYMTAGDSRVRDAHRSLQGVVKPINDPFWDRFYPPNGWQCRCYVVQTAARPTDQNFGNSEPKDFGVQKGFDSNVAKTGQVFDEAKNPTLKGMGKEAQKTAQKEFIIEESDRLRTWAKANLVEKAVNISNKALPKTFNLSNRDLKDLLRKPHADREGRIALLYHLPDDFARATLIKSYPEEKGRTKYLRWYYFKSPQGEYYYNVVELENGEFRLHAVTDKIQES